MIIGGGDTGADCLGTAHRQGAASVHQLEIMAEPPSDRLAENPWPLWPLILRTSSAHEEGGERLFSVTTTEFVDDGSGAVRALRGHTVEMRTEDGRTVFEEVPGTEFELECELVLLAMGFVGTERRNAVDELGVEVGPRGTVVADGEWATNVDGVFVCGDQTRGQSLIVWAIAEGRSCAAAVDRFLMGTTALPAPLVPGPARPALRRTGARGARRTRRLPGMDATATPEWQALGAHYEKMAGRHLRELFAEDPERATRFTAQGGRPRARLLQAPGHRRDPAPPPGRRPGGGGRGAS